MDNYLLLAYLHIGQEASNTSIESEAFEACIGQVLTKVSQEDFLFFVDEKVKRHPKDEHITGDMIAYLLACSYGCTNPEDQEHCRSLIKEVLAQNNFKTQAELEKSYKVKAWELMKQLYPEKIQAYEAAQQTMPGKVRITAIKRKQKRDHSLLAEPVNESAHSDAVEVKWYANFIQTFRNIPRNSQIVWDKKDL